MKIDKVIILDSLGKKLENEINDCIKDNQGKYNLVNIINVNHDIMLCFSKAVPNHNHMGYQNKHLLENGNIRPQTSDKATSRQLSYLNTLIKQTGEKIDTSNLTKRQAGQLIGKLKKDLNTNNHNQSEDNDDEFNPEFNMDDVESMFDNE